ncbi:RNA-directed DNA polymerase from mobile element jockey [Collichthys lucidus]|uniref:ribonuclease H n=1 Tax=Collichthys lucidus TaxID=240159 RepID=A0A4U5TWD6_COLLU|nr:RNA-directed DNA polymerase from mobile element jockey [Collichthys lucidus]
MSALMEDIREALLAVLPSLPEDKVQSLLNKLASIGVESKSDLQFIKEEDLPANITPIQCRRLLNAWQTQEKYKEGQLHCVFVDLEKACDRVPRGELWYCMRKSGVTEKYVRAVVRCVVGVTEEFKVEVGLHQGSALSPFLFAMVMDRLTDEVRQESPWTMMFADDIVICSKSREQVEEKLERWRFALERREMKFSHSKTEYMCVNERDASGRVRLQGEEIKKVEDFKYLGTTVQNNGECGKAMKKRVQTGWNAWRKVSGVMCDRTVSAKMKGKVYKTVVREVLFGSDQDG